LAQCTKNVGAYDYFLSGSEQIVIQRWMDGPFLAKRSRERSRSILDFDVLGESVRDDARKPKIPRLAH
jgi:hypothetical protein